MKTKNYPEELLGTKMKKDMNVGTTMPPKNITTKLKTKFLKTNLTETEDIPDVDPTPSINPYPSTDLSVAPFTLLTSNPEPITVVSNLLILLRSDLEIDL